MPLRGSGGDENGPEPRHTPGGTGVSEVVKAAVPKSPKNKLTRVRPAVVSVAPPAMPLGGEHAREYCGFPSAPAGLPLARSRASPQAPRADKEEDHGCTVSAVCRPSCA